jgi:phage terminase small subunit
MMRIASEFGFTPASRSRISTPSVTEATLFDRLEEPLDDAAE